MPKTSHAATGADSLSAMSHTAQAAAPGLAFEPEFIAGLKLIYEEKIVFNKTIGLKITHISADRVAGAIAMRQELVGHPSFGRLHGGVISAGLDAIGSLAVLVAIGARHMSEPVPQRLLRFVQLGTIDLHVDYLRPGIGEHFVLQAQLLRLGRRVASARMEFLSADGKLLAAGSAAYIVS